MLWNRELDHNVVNFVGPVAAYDAMAGFVGRTLQSTMTSALDNTSLLYLGKCSDQSEPISWSSMRSKALALERVRQVDVADLFDRLVQMKVKKSANLIAKRLVAK